MALLILPGFAASKLPLTVRGTVTAVSDLEAFVYLKDGEGKAWRADFQRTDYPTVTHGEEIAVAGSLHTETDSRPRLREAKVVERFGTGKGVPRPLAVKVSDVGRHPVKDPGARDLWGESVRLQGKIIDINRRDRWAQVLLSDEEGGRVQIFFHAPYDQPLDADFRIGGVVEATGIALYTPLSNPWSKQIEGVAGPLLYVERVGDITFLTHAPFWTAPKVYTLFAFVLFAAGTAIFWVRWSERAKADAVRRERLRLSHDLHDGFQQLLAGSMFRLEAAMNFLPEGADQAREQLERVSDSLYHTQTGLRAALWSMTEESEGPSSLSGLVRYAASRLAHWTGIVHFAFKGEECPVSRKIASDVLLLLQEAVGNALRHGHATKVEVKIFFRPRELLISIRDNGCGFDPVAVESSAGHLGLRSMSERAEGHKGALSITSESGVGTIVVVRIPYEACV